MFVLMPDGLEVLGAGIATCLSNCVACLFFLSVLLRMGKDSIITFSPRVGLPQKENMIAVFAVGVPSAIATFLFDMDYVIIDKLMVSYGDLALAAVGIVLKVERFPLNVGIGICQGMLPLVAYNCAAQNKQRMEDTIRLSRTLGLVIAGISIVLYELFATQFTRLFISDPQTLEMAAQFLRIRVLATPLMFFELLYRLPVPILWKGTVLAVSGRDPLAGVQYPHAVPAERHFRHVWDRLVPGGGGYSDRCSVLLYLS